MGKDKTGRWGCVFFFLVTEHNKKIEPLKCCCCCWRWVALWMCVCEERDRRKMRKKNQILRRNNNKSGMKQNQLVSLASVTLLLGLSKKMGPSLFILFLILIAALPLPFYWWRKINLIRYFALFYLSPVRSATNPVI